MITLEVSAKGIVLLVKAHAGGKHNEITGDHAGALKVSVTQAPEKGKANNAILEVIAEALGLKRSQIELIVGQTVSQKKFLIRDITREALEQRLAIALGEGGT
ncbi:MAG TPA: DUF167 domain-containing protein [Schlesneria sp.]|jgi:hypothetical protein